MPKRSIKHLQIDKANHTVVIAAAVGVSIVVFGLFISKAIWTRYAHQEKVITAKTTALEKLEENVAARDSLVDSYKTFVEDSTTNLIGGSTVGTELKDGDNARLVLDALPSKYDFPALITSLSTALDDAGYKIESMSGVDEEATYSDGAVVATSEADSADVVEDPEDVIDDPLLEEEGATTTAVEMPVGFQLINLSYQNIQDTVSLLDNSIRPFNVQRMKIEGGGNSMTITVSALAYYQPEVKFTLGTEEIK